MTERKVNESLVVFNNILTAVIVERCKGKKVCVMMSGGLDSRLILSILQHNSIPCDIMTFNTFKLDVKIARKVVDACPVVENKIFYDEDYSLMNEHKDFYTKFFDSYDVVLNGHLMSGGFDKFDHFLMSEKEINGFVDYHMAFGLNDMEHIKSVFYPACDKRVADALLDVPVALRYFGLLQKKLIQLNYPYLMTYGWTSWSLKKRIARLLYWYTVGLYVDHM